MARENASAVNPPEVEEIISRCQAGEIEAFDRLVERYERFVFNIVYQHVGAGEEVEDIAQEIFLRIFRFIKKFRRDCSLETWIYKVALNCIRSYRKRQSLFFRIFVHRPKDNESSDQSPPYETMLGMGGHQAREADWHENEMIVHEIIAAVRSLPPMFREVFLMREIEGYSYEEIAKIIGISTGTVKSRLNRARELLRRKVKL